MAKQKDALVELRAKTAPELEEIVRDTIAQLYEKRVMRHFEGAGAAKELRLLKQRLSWVKTVLTEKQ